MYEANSCYLYMNKLINQYEKQYIPILAYLMLTN